MSGTQHTPGPWRLTRCGCGHPTCKQWFISVTGSDGRVSEADGRLMAAAPNLLAAAKQAVQGTRLDPLNSDDDSLREIAESLPEGWARTRLLAHHKRLEVATAEVPA